MTFTYDDELATDHDRVRFHLQDTIAGSGPRPSGGNFTDAEIAGLVTLEGSWQRAVAAGLEALAAAWAKYADLQVGQRRESLGQIAVRYQQEAEHWRHNHGSASQATASIGYITRVDAYSDSCASDDA